MDEVTAVSLSLVGTAGAASVAFGLAASFLLKKLPKIEPLLLDLGAVSRLVVPVAGSTAEVTGVPPATLVILSVVPAVVGTVSPSVARGAPTTRAARKVSHGILEE